MVAALQATINTPQSDRLNQILKMASWLLNVYFIISLRDVSDCITCYLRLFLFFATLICSLIPLLMSNVIKPGPAHLVDPRPGRLGTWTNQGNTKDRCKEKTGQTRVRPGIYILTHLSGNLGKKKES
ncbi:hypothetical protein NC653_004272 [Populus alba x Populus x berolinensis]|uniref:Uncharacterized protein n=1 Tax=Populus alba x Populus x berolinensis TaxID=444605 RepID=A0AAD6WJ67_9ROSI|nr:hypothetical protein NC653_004272 [Populus alba x Populus x berolinensis]